MDPPDQVDGGSTELFDEFSWGNGEKSTKGAHSATTGGTSLT